MVEATNRTIFAAVKVQKKKKISDLYKLVLRGKGSYDSDPVIVEGTCLSSYKTSNQLHPAIWEKRLLSNTSYLGTVNVKCSIKL